MRLAGRADMAAQQDVGAAVGPVAFLRQLETQPLRSVAHGRRRGRRGCDGRQKAVFIDVVLEERATGNGHCRAQDVSVDLGCDALVENERRDQLQLSSRNIQHKE